MDVLESSDGPKSNEQRIKNLERVVATLLEQYGGLKGEIRELKIKNGKEGTPS